MTQPAPLAYATPSPQFQPLTYAIDFGTSNSLVVAANRECVTAPIPIDDTAADPTILRSILYFPERNVEHEMLFGDQALTAYTEAGMQGRFLRSLKRFLPDPGFSSTIVNSRRYRLEELIAAMLRTMRQRANHVFGANVTSVLLGRPARYASRPELDQLAEGRMREAAQLAGFERIEFFPEPVAAARDAEADLSEPRTVMIADLGGGTSDFSIVRMDHNGFRPEDVLATHGISVAGDGLDGALMRKELSVHFGSEVHYRVSMGNNALTMPAVLIDKLCTPAKLPLLQAREVHDFLKHIRSGAVSEKDRECVERFLVVAEDAQGFNVFEAVEHAKRELSQADNTEFHYNYADIDIKHALTRPQFERACHAPISEILRCVDETLKLAKLEPAQIDLVCLTGGTSRVPQIAESLEQRFGRQRLWRLKGLHSVVQGLGQEAKRLLLS